jgi:hypothetical protein
MKPKEKAEELFDKFVDLSGIFVGDYESEKSMCLIVVDEILESHYKLLSGVNPSVYKYWQEVKQEIEKL